MRGNTLRVVSGSRIECAGHQESIADELIDTGNVMIGENHVKFFIVECRGHEIEELSSIVTSCSVKPGTTLAADVVCISSSDMKLLAYCFSG